jgi:hypothetical protein
MSLRQVRGEAEAGVGGLLRRDEIRLGQIGSTASSSWSRLT